MRFRFKPREFDAVQWTGLERDMPKVLALVDFNKLPTPVEFVEPGIGFTPASGTLYIPVSDEDTVEVEPGDWLLRDDDGVLSVCTGSMFDTVYEPVT